MAIAIGLVLVAVIVFVLAQRLRRQSGLPTGRVIYSDAGAWQRNEQSMFSKRHGIVGKPDYLVQDGDEIVPVELKSGKGPQQPREGHILQLATYCLLTEETFGTRPHHGIIQYADRRFVVDYTPALEAELLRVIGAMRHDLAAGDARRSHRDRARCASCGVQAQCDERMA